MSTRIWLKASAAQSIKQTGEKYFGKPTETLGEGGPRIEIDDTSGEKYISFHGNIMDPAAGLPKIDHAFIKRVTYQGKIYEGFRTDGLYKARGATLSVSTYENVVGGHMNDNPMRERYQNISISGRSIRGCQFIYNGVRNGSIRIDSNWGLPQHRLPEPIAEGPAH